MSTSAIIRTACNVFAATAFFVVTISAWAEQSQVDEAQLIADVQADGILFGFAQACKLPDEMLDRFLALKRTAAQEVAQSKAPHYTPRDFESDFRRGAEVAMRLAASTDPTSAEYRQNCEEVRQKILSLLQK